MIVLTAKEIADLQKSAEYWEGLAADQRRQAEDFKFGSTAAYAHRADLYERTAKALRLKIETGQDHCVTCMNPTHNGQRCPTLPKEGS